VLVEEPAVVVYFALGFGKVLFDVDFGVVKKKLYLIQMKLINILQNNLKRMTCVNHRLWNNLLIVYRALFSDAQLILLILNIKVINYFDGV
jgi:hypothetical protein